VVIFAPRTSWAIGCAALWVAEDQVGGDDYQCTLVEIGDQMEQALTAGLGEGQIAQFIRHVHFEARELCCQGARLSAT